MRSRSKLLLTGLTAALVLAAAVGTSSANNLSISSGSFRIIWARLSLNNNSGLIPPVICPVTLEGSFHRATTTKTRGSLIGYVTRASVGTSGSSTATCEGGTATILTASLPWHVTYEGFTGSLPRPSGIIILLRRASFAINAGTGVCLAVTGQEANENAAGVANLSSDGTITSLSVLEERTIRLTGGFPCELARGFFRGTATVSSSTGTAIRVTLI